MTKRKIRKGLFETNSSSIHCITIGNNGEDYRENLPTLVEFYVSEFGWEHDVYHDTQSKADYLYTLIRYNKMDESYVEMIRKTLEKYGIETYFQKEYKYTFYYVDHGSDAMDLVQKLCADEELLMNYLFSEGSVIETGNDNEEIDWCAEKPKNILLEYEKGN